MFKRYAVFFTPPDGTLEEFGAAWLGWSSLLGEPVAPIVMPGFDIPYLTKMPRKYGFHGTLKAPFRLIEGADQNQLEAACRVFAQNHVPVQVPEMIVSDLRGFLALRPSGNVIALNALAASVTRYFDKFRAAPTETETRRRLALDLTQRQIKNFKSWGYPFVMDDFSFHMTLSGKLEFDVAEVLSSELQALISPHLHSPFVIDAITLMGENPAGMFRQIERYSLGT